MTAGALRDAEETLLARSCSTFVAFLALVLREALALFNSVDEEAYSSLVLGSDVQTLLLVKIKSVLAALADALKSLIQSAITLVGNRVSALQGAVAGLVQLKFFVALMTPDLNFVDDRARPRFRRLLEVTFLIVVDLIIEALLAGRAEVALFARKTEDLAFVHLVADSSGNRVVDRETDVFNALGTIFTILAERSEIEIFLARETSYAVV